MEGLERVLVWYGVYRGLLCVLNSMVCGLRNNRVGRGCKFWFGRGCSEIGGVMMNWSMMLFRKGWIGGV